MDLDFDPSGDLSGSNNARAVRKKFKPTPKLAPVKAKTVMPVISALPQIDEEKAATPLTNNLVVDVEKCLMPPDAMHSDLTDSSGFHLDASASAPEKDASAPFLGDAVTDKVPSISTRTECIEPSVLCCSDPMSSDTVEFHRNSTKDNTVMSPGLEPIQDIVNGIICDKDAPAPASDDDLLASSTFGIHSSASSFSFKLQDSSTFLGLDSGEIFCHPEIQNENEYPGTGGLSSEDVNSAMPSGAQCTSDVFHLDDGSIPGFPPDDVVNYSAMSFADFIDSNPSGSDFPGSEEQMDINNSSHVDDMHNIPQKEVNDNPSDECGRGQFHVDPSTSSVPGEGDGDIDSRVEDEVDNTDEEFRADRKPKKRKASKNPKKPVPDKEKTVRKRKKPIKLPEKPVEKPQKKFSHSTRRKKERVKELLSIPQDEIDLLRLPIKDICLLGEHNDMLAKKEAKEAKEAGTFGTNHSVNDSSRGAYSYDEEDPFGFEQDDGYTGARNYSREGPSNTLFNSRSFMDREPRARWSKQDTELFYEGIRQFGSNLSMIQQLFPGRTRDHMKKKFHKEGREHPARLTEAMRSRTTDHSYLKMALEQVRKASAQSESISIDDDPDDRVGKEETELDFGTNDEEAANSKQEEDVSNGDPVVGGHEALGSDGGEDDWTYDSEL